jgi:hypothetical protein
MRKSKVLDTKWNVPANIDAVPEQWVDGGLRTEIENAIFDSAGYEIQIKIWKVKKAQT